MLGAGLPAARRYDPGYLDNRGRLIISQIDACDTHTSELRWAESDRPQALADAHGSMWICIARGDDLVLFTEGTLFSHPARYLVRSESPVRADPESRNPALPDQLINRGLVDSQYLADFLHR
jgi:hypothetical protein